MQSHERMGAGRVTSDLSLYLKFVWILQFFGNITTYNYMNMPEMS